jgi:hypothetical protein
MYTQSRMGIYETYSKRMKRLQKAGHQEIYQHDDLPHHFRGQVVWIWKNAIGRYCLRFTGRSGGRPKDKLLSNVCAL